MVIFHSYVNVYQRVTIEKCWIFQIFPYKSPFSHAFPMVFPWFSQAMSSSASCHPGTAKRDSSQRCAAGVRCRPSASAKSSSGFALNTCRGGKPGSCSSCVAKCEKKIYINLHIFTCSIQIYLYLYTIYIYTLYIYTLYIYTLYILLYGYADHNDLIMGYYHTYRNNESIDVMMFIRQHQEK